jgi:hypothetical protein
LLVAGLAACSPPGDPQTTTGAPTTPGPAPPTTKAPVATTTTLPPVHRAATTTAAPPPVPPAGACPTWTQRAQPTVRDTSITEASGLAGGRVNPGVWWTHNDSGDGARVFALEGDARLLTTVDVLGAQAWDWEDIDIGPGPDGKPYLWVADLGDNLKVRQRTIGYQLYRFPEPSLGSLAPAALSAPAERIEVVYPNGAAHNVEATFVDPITGDYIIITKETPATVFRIPAASLVNGATVTPQIVGTLSLDDPGSTSDRPVGADISWDGRMIVVKLLNVTFLWSRAPGQAVAAALAAPPCPPQPLGVGEGAGLQRQRRPAGHAGRGPGRAAPRLRPRLTGAREAPRENAAWTTTRS